ncbi:MAG TPA: hypothetical protein VLI54_04155 [Bacillota bacterium]|nr:hypothetical protein [Bacillota bacterium]
MRMVTVAKAVPIAIPLHMFVQIGMRPLSRVVMDNMEGAAGDLNCPGFMLSRHRKMLQYPLATVSDKPARKRQQNRPHETV